jgi:hypothetical protein
MSHRGVRRPLLVTGVLPAVLLLWLSAGCASPSASPESGRDVAREATAVTADYYVSQYGVRVGVKVGFAERRTVTGVRLLAGHRSSVVSPYPLDGTDSDAPLRTVDLPAGTRMLLEGEVTRGCPGAPDLPVFEVSSRLDGERRLDRYRPDDRSAFTTAFRRWCHRGVSVTGVSSRATPDGHYTLRLGFTNPGPHAVRVVSQAFERSGARWERASLTVRGGEQGDLVLRGHGPPECRIVTPWATGHVLVDGVPLGAGAVEDWC